jgi:hypothetical protein
MGRHLAAKAPGCGNSHSGRKSRRVRYEALFRAVGMICLVGEVTCLLLVAVWLLSMGESRLVTNPLWPTAALVGFGVMAELAMDIHIRANTQLSEREKRVWADVMWHGAFRLVAPLFYLIRSNRHIDPQG